MLVSPSVGNVRNIFLFIPRLRHAHSGMLVLNQLFVRAVSWAFAAWRAEISVAIQVTASPKDTVNR